MVFDFLRSHGICRSTDAVSDGWLESHSGPDAVRFQRTLLPQVTTPGSRRAHSQTPLFIPVTVVATAFSAAHLLPLGGTTLIIPGYILGGITFIAGIIWFLDHQSCEQASAEHFGPSGTDLNLQQFALALGLITGLGLSIRNGAKGWFNIYMGNEDFWSAVLWWIVGPLLVVSLFLLIRKTLRHRHCPSGSAISGVSATRAFWLVLIVQNVLGHLVTGPPSQWNEVVFNIYYLLLFLITAVIAVHYQARQHQSNGVDFGTERRAGYVSALIPRISNCKSGDLNPRSP